MMVVDLTRMWFFNIAFMLGYRISDPHTGELDSLSHSDDSDGGHDEDDDFADDEAMTNPDSSSQEYLDDTNYLEDDDSYGNLINISDGHQHHRGPSYGGDAQKLSIYCQAVFHFLTFLVFLLMYFVKM